MSNDDFAKEVRELWQEGVEADKDNRKEMLIDQEFAGFKQWDDRTRQQREAVNEKQPFPLPCLTISTIQQLTGQVTGDRRANQTSIKVLPREDGDIKVAEVRSELIRSIELQSKADRVRMQAFENQVIGGLGNTKIELDWAYEDAFDRDLFIRSIPNPLAVNWDPFSTDPTGRDAKWCFVSDRLKKDEYEKQYPKAATTDILRLDTTSSDWLENDTVRIAEYWKIDERDRTIAMLQNGDVIDITDTGAQAYKGPVPIYIRPDGQPQVRKSKCKYAVRVLTNGVEELDDPFELKLYRVPIVRWTGREVWLGDKRVRFGLVRAMRDQQRLKNYLRSVAAQKLMFAPRANFMTPQSAIKGREADWPNALIYNDGAQPPTEISESNLSALVQMSQMFAEDMKDTTGIHDASLGIRSNETSGIAIQRRQHEGDIATIGYHDNANAAMEEEGEILNALLDLVYDTPRTIRVIGEDEATRLVRINDPQFQPNDMVKDHVNLATGRYDVAITTGPAYMTKRQEAAAQLTTLAQANENFAQVAPDLIVKALDMPDGDIIAERMKRTVPAQYLGDDEQANAKDPEAAAKAKMQAAQAEQQQQMMAELAQRRAVAETAETEAKARKANAEADKAEAEAQQIKATLALAGASMASDAADADEMAMNGGPMATDFVGA